MNYSRTTATSFRFEKRILLGLGALLVLLASLYTYFVMLSIAAVVEREELVQTSRGIGDSVARLEREYLARSNQLNEAVAYQHGYVAVGERLYVERGTLTLLSNTTR